MTDEQIILEWCDIIDSMPAGTTPVTEACRRLIKQYEQLAAKLEQMQKDFDQYRGVW